MIPFSERLPLAFKAFFSLLFSGEWPSEARPAPPPAQPPRPEPAPQPPPMSLPTAMQPSDIHDATWGVLSAVYGGAVHPTAEAHAKPRAAEKAVAVATPPSPTGPAALFPATVVSAPVSTFTRRIS